MSVSSVVQCATTSVQLHFKYACVLKCAFSYNIHTGIVDCFVCTLLSWLVTSHDYDYYFTVTLGSGHSGVCYWFRCIDH